MNTSGSREALIKAGWKIEPYGPGHIVYLTGDATKPAHPQTADGAACDAIAHVVNNVGAWGAGFSGALTRRLGPIARDTYTVAWVRQPGIGPRELGGVSVNLTALPGHSRGEYVVPLYLVHLFAQDGLPSATNRRPFRLDALQTCVRRLIDSNFLVNEPRFHMPRIGTGYGGSTWECIEPVVAQLAAVAPVYVYDLPGPGGD